MPSTQWQIPTVHMFALLNENLSFGEPIGLFMAFLSARMTPSAILRAHVDSERPQISALGTMVDMGEKHSNGIGAIRLDIYKLDVTLHDPETSCRHTLCSTYSHKYREWSPKRPSSSGQALKSSLGEYP